MIDASNRPKPWTGDDLRILRAFRDINMAAFWLDRPREEVAEMAADLKEWIESPPLAPM